MPFLLSGCYLNYTRSSVARSILAYSDLKSAFDSVDRQALWKALRGTGMPHILLKLIEDLHTGTTSRVRLDGMMSDSFSTSSGVRQGCILAPAVFYRAIDWIMERTARKAGVQVGNKLYTDPDYADDIVLMAEQTETLRSTPLEFHQTAADLGLHLSWQKPKIQNLGSGDSVADITVAGNTVEAVTEFRYLGSIQSSSGRCCPDLHRWIGLDSCTLCSAAGDNRD